MDSLFFCRCLTIGSRGETYRIILIGINHESGYLYLLAQYV